jgi:hypothetical protein
MIAPPITAMASGIPNFRSSASLKKIRASFRRMAAAYRGRKTPGRDPLSFLGRVSGPRRCGWLCRWSGLGLAPERTPRERRTRSRDSANRAARSQTVAPSESSKQPQQAPGVAKASRRQRDAGGRSDPVGDPARRSPYCLAPRGNWESRRRTWLDGPAAPREPSKGRRRVSAGIIVVHVRDRHARSRCCGPRTVVSGSGRETVTGQRARRYSRRREQPSFARRPAAGSPGGSSIERLRAWPCRQALQAQAP